MSESDTLSLPVSTPGHTMGDERVDETLGVSPESPRRPSSFLRLPTLKREKSNSDTLERKGKRVKFSNSDEDDHKVQVETLEFEPRSSRGDTEEAVEEQDTVRSSSLSTKVTKLLRRRSKKLKLSIETQTDGASSPEAPDAGFSPDSLEVTPKSSSGAVTFPPVIQIEDTTNTEETKQHDEQTGREENPVLRASIEEDTTRNRDDEEEEERKESPLPVLRQVSIEDAMRNAENSSENILYIDDLEGGAEVAPEDMKSAVPLIRQGTFTLEDNSSTDSSNSYASTIIEISEDVTKAPEETQEATGSDSSDTSERKTSLRFSDEVFVEPPGQISLEIPIPAEEDLSTHADKEDANKEVLAVRRSPVSTPTQSKAGPSILKSGPPSPTSPKPKTSARSTLINAFRSATKAIENVSKTSDTTRGAAPPERSRGRVKATPGVEFSTSKYREQKAKENRVKERREKERQAKEAAEKKAQENKENLKKQRLERSPINLLRKKEEGHKDFRSRKIDSEKERLMADYKRLQTDKERLQLDLADTRARLEEEVTACKALRRNYEQRIRTLKGDEAKRHDIVLADLRNRLEGERREALRQQKQVMSRVHKADLAKAEREREQESKRLHQEAKVAQDNLRVQLQREVTRAVNDSLPTSRCSSSDREVERLAVEVRSLKENKRKLEESLQVLQEVERERTTELRRVREEHETFVARAQRNSRTENSKMLDELRAKERTIGSLEKRVSQQAEQIRRQQSELALQLENEEAARRRNKARQSSSNSSTATTPTSTLRRHSRSPQKDPARSPGTPTSCSSGSDSFLPATEPGCKKDTQGVGSLKDTDHHTEKLGRRREEEGEKKKEEVGGEVLGKPQHKPRRNKQKAMEAELDRLRNLVEAKDLQICTLTKDLQEKSLTTASSPPTPPTAARKESSSSEMSSSATTLTGPATPPTPTTPTTPTSPSPSSLLTQYSLGTSTPKSSQQWANRVSQLENEVETLKAELQEARDQAELLEFRVLELTEGADRASDSFTAPQTVDQWTATDECYVTDVGVSSVSAANEDLSLPLSIDSGLDLSNDYKRNRLEEGRTWLAQLTKSSAAGECERSAAAHLAALLDWVSPYVTSGHSHHGTTSTPMSPTLTSTPTPSSKGMGVETCHITGGMATNDEAPSTPTTPTTPTSPTASDNNSNSAMGPRPPCEGTNSEEDEVEELGGSVVELGRDLSQLAGRLHDALASQLSHDPILLATISKLRTLEETLCLLHNRVRSLSEENRDLHEAVATLSEAHETRTEASGTESEIVHRKTPSLHSDLSDAESDAGTASSPPRNPATLLKAAKLAALDVTASFQESGIFDTSCELVHTATQTEISSQHLGDIGKEGQDELLSQAECELQKSECDMQKTEVDLRSAVARLASIKSAVQVRDLKHRLQDLQESDEYLCAAIEEDRVTLSKLEYDSFVLAERKLQQECEHLKYERQQIEQETRLLKLENKELRQRTGSSAEESLKGKIKVLTDQLSYSERVRKENFDEKCELEEAENDARLMVQRLESQMEAAREMESLLSASLAQEQEISRELQRRLRELQIVEKERRYRLERLDAELRDMHRRYAGLASARDALAAQLSFTAYGLLLAGWWQEERDSKALVLWRGDNASNCKEHRAGIQVLTCEVARLRASEADLKDELRRKNVSCPEVCDVCVQTERSEEICSRKEADLISESVPVANLMDLDIGEELFTKEDVAVRRARQATPEGEADSEEPLSKRPRPAETTSVATMTIDLSQMLTDREQFYLEQIEALQKEKMSLRKEYENERVDSLNQHQDHEDEMNLLRLKIEEIEREKCSLLFKLEESDDQKEALRQEMLSRIEVLKGDMTRYNELHDLEIKALKREYEDKLKELVKDRTRHEKRADDMEGQLKTLRTELEVFSVSIAHDLVQMDTAMEDALQTQECKDVPSNNPEGESNELLTRLRELIRSESALKQKIAEFEKTECAYRETIKEADKIMSSHVTSYRQRIEELEALHEQQASRIRQLESSEDRLRSSLRSSSRTSEGARISDLLDKLIETENSELKLKEQVWTLEKSEKELQIKLMEAEKDTQGLRSELRDQEELMHRLVTLETENNTLSLDLAQLQETSHRLGEVQQSESYLKGRVEELEQTEGALRDTLRQTDFQLVQRERKLREQVSTLMEELQTYKYQLEVVTQREATAHEVEVTLRKQLEDVKGRLNEAEKDLKESSSESISYETQHRTEVTKLRNQLKLANTQLTELDQLNCTLREQLGCTTSRNNSLAQQLEEQARREEQSLLALNLQVSSRDSRIEELEAQLEHISHTRAALELDALAATPITALHTRLSALLTSIQNCSVCMGSSGEALEEVRVQLSVLARLLDGSKDDASGCESGDEAASSDAEECTDIETAENLATDAGTTSPPIPAGEGHQEHSSGEPCLPHLSSKSATPSAHPQASRSSGHHPDTAATRRDGRRRGRRRQEERRRAQQPPGTILEELEEKVRELEEAVGRKEEELRLADSEAAELQAQLQSKEKELQCRTSDLSCVSSAAAQLRQQLVETMGEYERGRLALQTQHQVELEEVARKVEQLTLEVERVGNRNHIKDSVIATLVQQIRAILRSSSVSVVVNQLRRLTESNILASTSSRAILAREEGVHTDNSTNSNNTNNNKNIMITKIDTCPVTSLPSLAPDFDIESVCALLSQPYEMAPGPPPVTPKNGPSSSHGPVSTSLSLLLDRRKSRIPRPLSSPAASGPSAPVPTPRTPTKYPPKAFPDILRHTPRTNPISSPKPSPPTSPKPSPVPSPKTSPKSKLLSAPKPSPHPSPKTSYRGMTMLSPSPLPSTQTPTPPRTVMAPGSGTRRMQTPQLWKRNRKPSDTRTLSSRSYLSDSRKIRRMVTSSAPLDEAVDCEAAPEWRLAADASSSVPSNQAPPEEPPRHSRSPPVTPTCVPKPRELRITRRVGVDGLLIAWAPLEHDCVAGFQVLVDGRLHQHVRSPHRTKALITGVSLATSFTVALVTLSTDGRCSTPVAITHDRSRVYPKRSCRTAAGIGSSAALPVTRREAALPTSL
ncbi:uncharacterized protein LOC143017827 isoform X3 [Oratosquilla oratoria]|uniref:uncharacterized protein LOC143017827 isoform X3 n=1 Tax=Oratosquilla oratoria TaxID=337810 RepID=UPI003F76BE05